MLEMYTRTHYPWLIAAYGKKLFIHFCICKAKQQVYGRPYALANAPQSFALALAFPASLQPCPSIAERKAGQVCAMAACTSGQV